MSEKKIVDFRSKLEENEMPRYIVYNIEEYLQETKNDLESFQAIPEEQFSTFPKIVQELIKDTINTLNEEIKVNQN